MLRFYNDNEEFAKLINKLKKNKNKIKLDDNFCIEENNCFTVFRIISDGKSYFYGCNEQPFGGGSYGFVFRAYLLDEASGSLNKNKSIAIKIIPENKFHKSEVDILKSIFGNAYFVKDNFYGIAYFNRLYRPLGDLKLHYIVTPYYPGKNLVDHPEIIDVLKFPERINLIIQILLLINNFHYEKPCRDQSIKQIKQLEHKGDSKENLTRPAIIHHDIKIEHILIEVLTLGSSYQTNVNLIDFGLSEMLPVSEEGHQGGGTPEYMSPEFHLPTRDTAKDIYALTPIFAKILGCNDPFVNKLKFPNFRKSIFQKLRAIRESFDLSGLLEDPEYAPPDPALIKLINDVLNRMQSKEPERRPDVSELLRFFISVRNYCVLYNSSSGNEDAQIELAKLISISKGEYSNYLKQI